MRLIAKASAVAPPVNPPHAAEIVKTFYDILTILDNKALALLAFDGIIVAATTFAAEKGDCLGGWRS